LIYYYQVIPLKNDKILTYSFHQKVEPLRYVGITILGRNYDAIIYKEISEEKIDFPKEKLVSISYLLPFYLPYQYFKTALFMKSYYFNSLTSVLNFFPRHPIHYGEPHQIEIPEIPLSTEQERAVSEIMENQTSLLFGDTGSGKTHIYKRLMAQTLKNGGDILFMVPEINLIPQVLERVTNRFGDIVAPWHSKVENRRAVLESIYSRKTRIVVGTLSSLFVPLQNLQLIIVDEEHSDSYTLDSHIRFNGRDMAIYLAKQKNIPILLGSATPSLNSYYKFPVVRLKGSFFKGEKKYIFERGDVELSETTLQKIGERFQKREQTIIFIPIRGNFKYISCNSCGYQFECPDCSVKLSLYSNENILKCNRCDFQREIPSECESCGDESISVNRAGTVEIVKQLKKSFQDMNIVNFDSDRVKKLGDLEQILGDFRDEKIDLLVGTQMISKGHDYPLVTLSVILGVDFMVNLSDFQSFEKSLSLVTQIAGRSGRTMDSEIILQTKYENFYKKFLGNYEKFLQYEIENREGFFPPFRHIFRLLISHTSEEIGEEILDHLELYIHFFSDIEILYSGEAPLKKEKRKWRFHILLRGEKLEEIRRFISEMLTLIPESFKSRIVAEINPSSYG
jgi:primosomal protein N' (replication factor Y)